jgi:hypothetical protein
MILANHLEGGLVKIPASPASGAQNAGVNRAQVRGQKPTGQRQDNACADIHHRQFQGHSVLHDTKLAREGHSFKYSFAGDKDWLFAAHVHSFIERSKNGALLGR